MKIVPLPRPRKNNAQIKSYVRAVQAGQKMYYLIPGDGKWIVKKALADKPSKVFDNEGKAMTYATKIAKTNKTELIIFGKNGRIQDRKSYENLPPSPK